MFRTVLSSVERRMDHVMSITWLFPFLNQILADNFCLFLTNWEWIAVTFTGYLLTLSHHCGWSWRLLSRIVAWHWRQSGPNEPYESLGYLLSKVSSNVSSLGICQPTFSIPRIPTCRPSIVLHLHSYRLMSLQRVIQARFIVLAFIWTNILNINLCRTGSAPDVSEQRLIALVTRRSRRRSWPVHITDQLSRQWNTSS